MPSEDSISEEFVALLRKYDPKAWRKFEARLKEHDVSCSLKACPVLRVFVDLLKDYNPEAWRVFIEDKRTQNLVRNIIRKLKDTYSQEDFEDIFQEACKRAWASASSEKARYRGDSLPRSWFTPIVHNAAVDHFTKKERKHEVNFTDLDPGDSNDPNYIEKLLSPVKEPSPENELLRKEFWDAVAGLPSIYIWIMVLYYRYGYTAKKIAHLLNEKGIAIFQEDTVSSYKSRAKEMTMERLGLSKWRGLTVRNLTKQQKQCCARRGWSGGVVVKSIEADSAAVRSGIKMNYVIVKIGLDPVCDVKEFARIVSGVKASRAMKITIACGTERYGELEITIPGEASNGKRR